MQINQFHSGTAEGDAITNQMIWIQKLLRENGYESEIYAEHIPIRLQKKIRPIKTYRSSKDAILLVHHSMGMDCFEQIIGLEDKKVLIYHNITPEKFFDDEGTKKYIRKGLVQAERYKNYTNYCIADSNYNRQELLHMGYTCDIDVMPVQISLERFDHIVPDKDILNKCSGTVNFIFVGRVVWNKRQEDVIRSFAVYNRYYNSSSRLFLIGDSSMQGYVSELKRLTELMGISESVVLTGKVSEEELKAYYESADIFLCMSEHEGFGVPLLEAMKLGVPVIAYRSCAIPETMDRAGVLVSDKNYAYIGTLLQEVLQDKKIYHGLVQKQYERIQRLESADTKKVLLRAIDNIRKNERKRTIQMQGPFETSYSLAIVNRKLMEAMDDLQRADISIYCTEGPGDYEPKEEDLKEKPHAKALWERSKEITFPDVTIRNLYPPRVKDVNGGLNFFAFGWEESVIPQKYINDFNQYLSGIGTMSDYVTEKLIECGLRIPVRTMGIGVELVEKYDQLQPYQTKKKKKLKFLHISSAFPRKGVDILLKGFYEAFDQSSDVCLVIKTFPNPHNNVDKIIKKLNAEYASPPEIEWINRDMTAKELNSLYKMADCYVQTARGEGFGLPVAEAMLARVPVIVSANSGMTDFCNQQTALLVGHTLTPAQTHLTEKDAKNRSMWSEPDLGDLVIQLRAFAAGMDEKRLTAMTEAAYKLISEKYTWRCVAERWFDFIREVESRQYRPKVAMVTTWNSKCGIAEYTKMQVEASMCDVEYHVYPNYGVQLVSEDEGFVQKRLWHSAFEGDMNVLVKELKQSADQIVHFQFNFGFFELRQFGNAIEQLVSNNKKVVITFHKTEDAIVNGKVVSLKSIVRQLNLCSALVVHQEKDRKVLENYGIYNQNIFTIAHGQIVYQEIPSSYRKAELSITSKLVIGSYGFLLPHKGVKEVIQAVALLKEIYPDILYMPICALHDSPESKEYYKECVQEAEKLGVRENVKFITEFLANNESMRYLQACDLMVMPYKPSLESASGAVRFCLAALKPTIVTKQQIFEEFLNCTYQIEACDVRQIINAVEMLLENPDESRQMIRNMKDKIRQTSWSMIAQKYGELYRQIAK